MIDHLAYAVSPAVRLRAAEPTCAERSGVAHAAEAAPAYAEACAHAFFTHHPLDPPPLRRAG